MRLFFAFVLSLVMLSAPAQATVPGVSEVMTSTARAGEARRVSALIIIALCDFDWIACVLYINKFDAFDNSSVTNI